MRDERRCAATYSAHRCRRCVARLETTSSVGTFEQQRSGIGLALASPSIRIVTLTGVSAICSRRAIQDTMAIAVVVHQAAIAYAIRSDDDVLDAATAD